MLTNYLTALPSGGVITLALLFGMHSLIAMQPGVGNEPRVHTEVPFIDHVRDDDPVIIDEKPKRPPKPEPLPPVPNNAPRNEGFAGPSIPTAPPMPAGDTQTEFGLAFHDGPLVALVRVEPSYPPAAVSRGLEGYVTVIFDVLPDGSTANIRVIESSSRVFERSAVQAAGRFRFKARVVDGQPQLSSGVHYRFSYRLDR